MPSKKKKYNARFPPARIKKIMQSDEEVGKVAQAVPVIISRALELFVESLLKKAEVVTNARNAKTLTPSHLKQCISAEHRFDFLKDLVATVPDVQGEEELAETPRSAITNSPFVFPPPSSTATSSSMTTATSEAGEGADFQDEEPPSVSYINDPNLVSYHIPPPAPPSYHHESVIVSPQSSILNPVGANSNPYIPIHHPSMSAQRDQFQYQLQSVQSTPPLNGFGSSVLPLSSVSSGGGRRRSNSSNSNVGVNTSDKDVHRNTQDQLD